MNDFNEWIKITKMKTQIDIRISYEINGNKESLRNADLIYEGFQRKFEKEFPEAKLISVYIAKSEVKLDKEQLKC